jgi:hypothetical protein
VAAIRKHNQRPHHTIDSYNALDNTLLGSAMHDQMSSKMSFETRSAVYASAEKYEHFIFPNTPMYQNSGGAE